jgi:integrase
MSRRDYGSGTIDERRPGRWLITIESGRDPRTGRRERRRFAVRGTRRDAQKALRDALQQRDSGTRAAPDKITLAEWLTPWLARHQAEGHIGLKSYDRYRIIIQCHLIPALGRLRLQELRPDHIGDMKARWLSGQTSTASQPLSGATVHKHLVVLRRALAEAVRSGIIVRNPADLVPAPSVKARTERRALMEEEIKLLVAAAKGSRYDLPIRFTLATGVRQGELLGLKWEDVDFDAGTVSVRRAMSYVSGKTTFTVPKTERSRRVIELSAASVRLLREYRVEQTKQRLMLGPAWHEYGLVFPSTIGTPWLARVLYRGYRDVLGRSGITDLGSVNWHTLRHTAATQWLRHGVDVFSVSRRLGHASASFTMDVYAHLLKGQQRQAAEALDYLLA